MKKLLFVLPIAALLCSCELPFQKVEEKLPEPSIPDSETSKDSNSDTPETQYVLKNVKLTKSNCGLTDDDSTNAFSTYLQIDYSDEEYEIEFGPDCYNHHTYNEFVIKNNGYFRSVSTFKVDRLRVDYFSTKGINFDVLDAGGAKVAPHQSDVSSEYPSAADGGAVLEYPINGTSWKIQCNSSTYKAAFYSVTIIFIMEI